MKELSLERTLLYAFIFFIVFNILLYKVLGSSNLPNLVERDGYCKTAYGDVWDYHEQNGYCYFGNETKTFTEQEFRDVCPKKEFFSWGFYSECFHKGEPRT